MEQSRVFSEALAIEYQKPSMSNFVLPLFGIIVTLINKVSQLSMDQLNDDPLSMCEYVPLNIHPLSVCNGISTY